jgi:Secretion system C-terminal sorting domain/CARDB
MNRVLPFAFFLFALLLFPFAQLIPQEDPFRINETGPRTIKSQDIFLLWMEDIGGGDIKSYQNVYRYKTDGILIPLDSLNIDTMMTKKGRREDSRLGKNVYVDVASGKFNRDPYDDVVSIWRTTQSNQRIEIMISHFDTTGFFTGTTAIDLNAGEDIRQDQEIYVRTGDFDADSLDEFLVAFRDLSDSVIFYLFDVDSTLQTTVVQRFSNAKVAGSGLTHFVKYFIETADLNDDGVDELVSYTWESGVQSTYVPITIRIYAFENGIIVPKGTIDVDVPKDNATGLQDFIMASARGQFDDDENDELVFSAVVKSNNIHVSHHYILNVSENLNTIFVGPRQQYSLTSVHSTNGLTEFGLAAGDLNDTYNKRDEVVFAAGDRIRVAAVNDDYSFQTKALVGVANAGTNDYLQSNNYLKVADMNMDNRKDIVIVKNLVSSTAQDGFLIATITFTDSTLNDGSEKVFARILGDESQNDVYHRYAIAVGNFDGFDFTIGQPEHSIEYGIAQPIVVLNAPPVHFDMINGTIYDINSCYNGGDCDFIAKYIKSTSQTIEITTKVNKDWLISAGLSVSGDVSVEPMGVGISVNYENHLLYNYGKHFSKDSTSSTTVTIEDQIEARDDDRIYTIITDYDVWEYPVFHGNESSPRNTLLTLVPIGSNGTWFGSKSYFAQNYFPDHEVSNILSYYDSLTNNPNVFQLLEIRGSDRYVVDGTSSYDKHWTFERFTNVNADTVKENGWDIGLTYGPYRFDGDFNDKEAMTHRTSVRSTLDLEIHLGNINPGIGQVEYAITPYAYWGTSDALILDYAVNIPEPVGEDSWWELMYKNNSDPTFILPWRLDPEKGFNLSEPAKRFNTKDLFFNPQKPEPGDTLTITVRVRNYSLIPTPSSVSVKFYLNDPDSGGTPILGVNGTNELLTNGPVPKRGNKNVELKWVVPNGLPSYPRIYAVLDQENSIAEIHEDNNKGYAILGSSSVTGVEDENFIIPEEYVLYQSYPNPFNPSTTIKYSLPNSDIVSLKVFDILGREVAILLDEYKTAGTHTVEFNASGLASGVYFYQLRAQNFVEAKKMVLLK